MSIPLVTRGHQTSIVERTETGVSLRIVDNLKHCKITIPRHKHEMYILPYSEFPASAKEESDFEVLMAILHEYPYERCSPYGDSPSTDLPNFSDDQIDPQVVLIPTFLILCALCILMLSFAERRYAQPETVYDAESLTFTLDFETSSGSLLLNGEEEDVEYGTFEVNRNRDSLATNISKLEAENEGGILWGELPASWLEKNRKGGRRGTF